MGMAQTLTDNLTTLGVLAIIIVIFIIILNKMNVVAKAQVADATNNASVQSFITTTITGLSEPKNWVAIIVIALVGFGIIKYVKSKKGD